MSEETTKRLSVVLLASLLAFTAAPAQEPSAPPPQPDGSPRDAADVAVGSTDTAAQTQQPQAPAHVDQGLVKKKVVVYFRDGRVYKGKLVELTDDFLRLKVNGRTEKVELTEVAKVERAPSRAALVVAITALAVGAVALVVLIAATRD